MSYVPRVGLIYVKTLTTSWAQILTEAQSKAIVGVKVTERVKVGRAPGFYDIAFTGKDGDGNDVWFGEPDEDDTAIGDGYQTNTGSGSGDIFSPSKGLWGRKQREQDTVILEITTYS